jgi:hypothetical protein
MQRQVSRRGDWKRDRYIIVAGGGRTWSSEEPPPRIRSKGALRQQLDAAGWPEQTRLSLPAMLSIDGTSPKHSEAGTRAASGRVPFRSRAEMIHIARIDG